MFEFLGLVKESSFNFFELYKKAPNETLIFFAIIFLIAFIIFFFVNKTFKINKTIKLIENLKNTKNYSEYNQKIVFLLQELPKLGEKVAACLNLYKEDIAFRVIKLLDEQSIKEKIDNYMQLSKNFKKLSLASKKYKNIVLPEFFEKKSKECIEKNLAYEIEDYYKNTNFDLNELENLNALVKLANRLPNKNDILKPLKKELDRFSFGYNTDLYKLIEKFDEKNTKQIFEYCKEKIDFLFNSTKGEISTDILDYLLENNQKQKVYDYISTLSLNYYLQHLYKIYFDRKDDLDLDLAFIANPLKIDSNYKEYIDKSLTLNYRDEEHIKYVSQAKGVLEVLGHTEFRALIQRIDYIAIEKENKKKVEEALAIAKEAKEIALETKVLNEKSVNIKS